MQTTFGIVGPDWGATDVVAFVAATDVVGGATGTVGWVAAAVADAGVVVEVVDVEVGLLVPGEPPPQDTSATIASSRAEVLCCPESPCRRAAPQRCPAPDGA